MARLSLRLIPALVFAASLTLPSIAQNSTPQSQSQPIQVQPQPAANQAPQNQADQPGYTLRTYTRLVNLELVVKDSKGNHIQGLKPEDFQVEEQTPIKSNKTYPQKIAEFREVHMAGMAAPAIQPETPKGVYTNAVTAQKDPVPPTVLLVDGLNTAVESQAQVHVQMLKMLRQLPANVPVAVFLLGDRLTLLQSFTSDPKLLQEALRKAVSTANVGMANMDPRDDPDSPANLATEAAAGDINAAGVIASISNFDMRIYTSTMDERVVRTINALTSLGENLSGYSGRKNLLWLSTSFPINLFSSLAVGANSLTVAEERTASALPGGDQWAETHSYAPKVRRLTAILSDAKIAVYPVNLAGVQTLQAYQAGAQPSGVDPGEDVARVSERTSRDAILQNAAVDTMHEVADGTGGIVCTGDNDLGDCVHKAVDDSSDFYEIAYYSDSENWNGEFRKIAVKTGLHGARLEYREGYFASPEGNPDPKIQSAQLQSDCDDYLDATSITFTAKNLPSDSPGQLKFSLAVDPAPLTFSPTADGGRQLNLDVAVCTYNEKDWPLKLMSYPVNLKLTPQQFNGLMTTGKLTDTIFVPGPKPAALRLMVKDVSTGKLGSVYIKTGDLVAVAPEKNDVNEVFQQ
jgi:VWFA-related protein